MLKQTQSFNDGVVNIYTIGNIAEPGNKPKEGLTLKVDNLRYGERIVGMGRFWTAQQAHAKIDQLIRTPQIRSVSTQDVAILTDGKQYRIIQIQYPGDITPPSMDLSLERLVTNYELS